MSAVDRGSEAGSEAKAWTDEQLISETRAERDAARAEPENWERADPMRAPDADKYLPDPKAWNAEEKAAIDAAAANRQEQPVTESPGDTGPHGEAPASASDTASDAEADGRHAGRPGDLPVPSDNLGEGVESRDNRDTGGAGESDDGNRSPRYVIVLDDAPSNPSFDPSGNKWSDPQRGEYVTVRPGESGLAAVERADRPLYAYERPLATDYNPNLPPTAEDRSLMRDKTNPIPLFDGPPVREQTTQGRFGDCGIVATLGAVAGHRPEAIQNAIKQTGDGKYDIVLHEVRQATPVNPVARPTGDTVTYKISDLLPVRTDKAARPPVGMKADSCGWPALMEKTVASQDQQWDTKRYTAWNQTWVNDRKPTLDAERQRMGLTPSPDQPPMGYNRLDTGSTPYDRADLLAELTGKAAEVRTMPGEQQGEKALLDDFRDRLADGKPILVGTRARISGEVLPMSRNVFAFGHAYEVTKVEDDKIQLRNPWGEVAGQSSDPPPMDVKTFWEYYRQYNDDGGRTGFYSTLR